MEKKPDISKGRLAYKWIVLTNTTLGIFMAMLDGSIVEISLPAIFHGIGVNPLAPGETDYLLWTLMGYLVVTATLLVTFGRISDMFGRVRLYNLGFAIFAVGSILLYLVHGTGNGAAMQIIIFRLVQAVGGAFLMANSTAILTDAFPPNQRGLAMGINMIAGTTGTFIGLLAGGILAAINWRYVFLVSVPFSVGGTIWAYLALHETATIRKHQHLDIPGNILFALGLTALLVGTTYGIQPYGNSTMGWGSPFVLACLIGGALALAVFVYVEQHVPEPMFRLELFKIRMFTAGNIAGFLASLARGGLNLMIIIWLQGIWLPLHGYSFEDTPLWAGIYMLPLTVGFLLMGPLSGYLSDRLWRPHLLHRRDAGHGGRLRRAVAGTGQFRLSGVCPGHPGHRHGHGDVRLSQHHRHHELGAGRTPRRFIGDARHLPEYRQYDQHHLDLYHGHHRTGCPPANRLIPGADPGRRSSAMLPPRWQTCPPPARCSRLFSATTR